MSRLPAAQLPAGPWGGEQVALDVTTDKAVLRLGCAEGEFAAPVVLDRDGRFSLPGRFTAFAGGPGGSRETARDAQFEGVMDGTRLTLTVNHGASTETHQLTQGLQSKVIRCL